MAHTAANSILCFNTCAATNLSQILLQNWGRQTIIILEMHIQSVLLQHNTRSAAKVINSVIASDAGVMLKSVYLILTCTQP